MVGTRASIAGLAAQTLAAAAGLLAVATLWSRLDKGVGPRELRDRYLAVDASITRLVVLDTRLAVHARDEQYLRAKVTRFRWSALLLFSATLCVVVGSTIGLTG